MIETNIKRKENKSLPKDWRIAKLKDVARIFAGSSAPQDKSFFDESGFPFVRVSDLGVKKRTTYLTEVTDHLSQKAINKYNLVLARKGATLFPKSGAAITTNNRAILGIDAHIVSHLMVVEPKEDLVTPLWLYWALCQIDMMKYSDNIGYPSLKQYTVGEISIILPPLKEQRRIENILTEQFLHIEKTKAAAEVQLEAAKALPAAYLREIFNSPEVQKWPRKQLGEICEFVGGMQPPKGFFHNEPKPGYVRLVQIQDFRIDDMAVYIPKELAKRNFDVDDVMVGRYGPPIFQILRGLSGAYNVALIKCIPKGDVTKDYVYYLLQESGIQKAVIDQSQRSAGQSGVNKKFLEKLIVPDPSIETQKRITKLLKDKFLQAKNLADVVQERLEVVNSMSSALLRKAFNGEL